MKIGVSSYSFSAYIATAADVTYEDICKKAKDMGYDGIEFVNLDAFGGKLSTCPIEDAKRIRECCERIGLEIFAYTVGADFLGPDPRATVRDLEQCVLVADELGARVMRHDITWKLPEGTTWQNAVPKVVGPIREVTDYAASVGIRTCSENHGFIFQDPERVRAVIDAVDRPNYGWLVDLGNFLCTDCDPVASVRVAAPYAFHVHAKDFKMAESGGIQTREGRHIVGTVAGRGVVDLKGCFDVLKEAGYDGTVSLEFEGPEPCLEALSEGHAHLRALLG